MSTINIFANYVQNLMRTFELEQIYHSPFSPDLVPSDFQLFCYHKEFFCRGCFDTNDEVKE